MPTTTTEGKEILRYISDHINNYLPTIKTESRHTLKSYTIAIDQYLEWLEDIKGFTAKTINKSCFEAKMIEEWLAWLVGTKNLSKTSANVKLAAVKSCVKHIAKQNPRYRYLLTEVCDVHRLKTPKRKIHGITRNAVKALFSVIDTSTKSARMYLPMFILMYGTGARIDEILSIKISDLSLSTDMPFVVLHGKGSKVRRANLLSRSVTLLSAFIKEFHGIQPDPEAYLFWTEHKGKYQKISQTAVRNALSRYALKAHDICPEVPVDLNPHQLRHAKATHLLEDGFNDVQVAEYLGHTGLATIHDYIDVSIDSRKDAYATLEDEKDKHSPKKWRNPSTSMRDIIGTKQRLKA